MRLIMAALLMASVGCDRLQKKPQSAEEQKKDQQQGTEDAAKEFAKKVVLQHLGVSDANFGWKIDAKQTTVEVKEIWWEIKGSVKVPSPAGKNERQDFEITAVKPIDSNHWKWVMCTIDGKSTTNASAL